jgi:hypothetical protein
MYIMAPYPSIPEARELIKGIKEPIGGIIDPENNDAPYVYVNFNNRTAGFAMPHSQVGETGTEVTWEQFKQALTGG